MARREALVAAAHVGGGVASALALRMLVDPFGTIYDGELVWFAGFFAVGSAASIAVGAMIGRWWAVALPGALVAAAVPFGELVDQLPLWVFLLGCSPFGAGLVAVGVAASKYARSDRKIDAHLAAIALCGPALALLIASLAVPQTAETRAELDQLAFGYPLHFAYSETSFTPPTLPQTYGFNPWEQPTFVDPLPFFASFALVYVALAILLWLSVGFARAAGVARRRGTK